MAELYIRWSDGRQEVRQLKRGGCQEAVVGTPKPGAIKQQVEIGNRTYFGGKSRPYLTVTVYGAECPYLEIVTANRNKERLVFGSVKT